MGSPRDLGPLGIMALALLDEQGPMHPYEMYQLLLKRYADRVIKLSAGTLYHTVDRLAAAGLLRATGTEREGNRPERTAYEVTDQGRAALKARVTELLATPMDEYPVFPVAVGEIHHLPRETAVALLRRRLEHLEGQQALIAERIEAADALDVPRRFLLAAHYLKSQLDAEVAWTRQLVADIESGALDWSALHGPLPSTPSSRTSTQKEST